MLDQLKQNVTVIHDPVKAVSGAHLVATDTWASMGQESEKNIREIAFKDFQVNEKLMDLSGLPNLRLAMKEHGYDEAIIKKICHENWLRVLQKTWGY